MEGGEGEGECATVVATRSWFCHQSTKCSMLGHGAVPPEHLVLGSPCQPCRCHSTPSGAGANPSSGGGGVCGGSEEEEAEINEVFLREEAMIKTSRVEPHANIKGHRMSKYRKGLYNKLCHCLCSERRKPGGNLYFDIEI